MNIVIMILLWLACAATASAAESAGLAIEGVSGDALANLEQALALPRGLVREGKVDRLWLERLRRQAPETARQALEPFGYYRPEIQAALETDEETLRLRVIVKPGDPVRVRAVEVAVRGPGEREEPLNRMVTEFPLVRGDVLLHENYETAKANLRARAQELGYLDAEYSAHEIRVSISDLSARVLLVLETGPRYYFGQVRIEGAPTYPERFLRRYVSFKPGDIFSYSRLGDTQLNYSNAERFRQVLVRPEKENAEDQRIPVLVQLEPLPRYTLNPGIGYGTDTGARFSIRYRDVNVFQQGHEFDANFFVAEVLQGVAARYVIPSSKDIRSSTGIQLNLQREDVDTYTTRYAALEIDRTRTIGRGKLGSVYLRIQQEDFTIGNQSSGNRYILPGIRFSQERYDNLIRPTSGHRLAFDLRGTHQYLGSDTGLVQLIVEGSRLLPLPWRSSLFLRGRSGITALNDPLADLPVSLRFFAGGDHSVRGYSYQSLGPRDDTGQVTGGRNVLTGSVGLYRDIKENYAVSGFFDTGNAFNSFESVRFYHGVGIGAHYYSPIGAINLYLARQLGVESPSFRIHFTVGFQL